jgi:hypothetical protein
MVPFVGVGVLVWILASLALPGAFLFPKGWLFSLQALTNRLQIVVFLFLTIVMMWSVCYSIGMLVLLSLRGSFRIWLGRRIAAQSQEKAMGPSLSASFASSGQGR